jgi:Peptidase family M23
VISDLLGADLFTQAYGCTDYTGEWVRPDCVGGHFHAGLDLGYSDGGNNHLGAPVYSPRQGVVVALGPVYPANGARYLGPYAPVIRSDAEGVFIELGHVQAVHVKVGDRVRAGQHVADLGTLGASTGGHLHLEVRTDGPIQGPPWSAILAPGPWLRYLPQEAIMLDPNDPVVRALRADNADLRRRLFGIAAYLAEGQWREEDGTLHPEFPTYLVNVLEEVKSDVIGLAAGPVDVDQLADRFLDALLERMRRAQVAPTHSGT